MTTLILLISISLMALFMGAYVNPSNTTKELWLEENGTLIPDINNVNYDQLTDRLPVCLVDNGAFTAAGIGFSKQEFELFQNPTDPRPKKWYLVETDKLHKVSPELKRYMSIYEQTNN